MLQWGNSRLLVSRETINFIKGGGKNERIKIARKAQKPYFVHTHTHTHTHTHIVFAEQKNTCHPCVGGDLSGPLRNRFPVKRGMTGAISLCHSCQAQRERESMLRQARHDTFVQMGRSMVEMLGVLAIMGIVGMIGVKMYTNAMNKHRANELIYEAQKRATMVAMQITAGQENLSVANFTNPTGYTFGVEKNPYNENQFNITITGVDSKVCQQIKTFVGPATPIRVISEFCDKLTYNNDLSRTAYASDIQNATECANAGNTWCGGSGVCADTEEDCCVNKETDQCKTCSKGAIVTSPMEGTECDYDENGTKGMCHLGVCQALPTNVQCDEETGLCACTNGGTLCNRSTGLCCATNQMCNTAGDVNTTNTTNQAKCLTLSASGSECTTNAECTDPAKPWCKITEATDCRTPNKGKCTALGTSATASVYGLGEILLGPNVNWWSAKNWCAANGKKLINVEAFQVYRANGTTLLTTGANTTLNACRQGKTCGDWSTTPYNAMWVGTSGTAQRTLTDARDANGELYSAKYSPVVLDLAKKYRGNRLYFWTASDYSKTDSCSAFVVHIGRGLMYNYGHDRGFDALCQ